MPFWLHVLLAVVIGLLSAGGVLALVMVVQYWYDRHRWDSYD